MVAGDVRRLLGSSSGDLTLRTTLNLELQRLAEGVIARRLEAEGAKKNVSQASLVALGKDGAILAMVGGRDYEASQFNRATQARRQAGSLFKLFVYLTALAARLHTAVRCGRSAYPDRRMGAAKLQRGLSRHDDAAERVRK